MNTNNEYMLLFSGKEWYNELSQEELQRIIDEAKAWFEGLVAKGLAKGGQALAREGAIVSGKRVISDGPFAESKEAIGGYLVISADSLEDAIAVAKTNPTLDCGTTIEIRPLSDECPLNARAKEIGCEGQLAAAHA